MLLDVQVKQLYSLWKNQKCLNKIINNNRKIIFIMIQK